MASSRVKKADGIQATRIVTVLVYVAWNYILHISYWRFGDSWLHYYVRHNLYVRLYSIHVLHAVVVVVYVIASFKSPGVVRVDQKSAETNSPQYCSVCQIIRPTTSKHCHECGKCIIRYDHHCIFLSNCIGANNHWLFVFYLCMQLSFLAWSLPMSIECVCFAMHHLRAIGYLSLLYRSVCTLGIAFAFIAMALLLLFHIYLILFNQTTYVTLKTHSLCNKAAKSNSSMFDAKHFDLNQKHSTILSNIAFFFTFQVPEHWKVGKMYDDLTPKTQWLSEEQSTQRLSDDIAGVGCVPMPYASFKQE